MTPEKPQQPTDGALREALRKHVEFLREREEASSLDYYADELEAILGRALAAQPAPVTDGALRAVECAVNALHQCIHKSGAMYQIRECIERIDAALRALAAQAHIADDKPLNDPHMGPLSDREIK